MSYNHKSSLLIKEEITLINLEYKIDLKELKPYKSSIFKKNYSSISGSSRYFIKSYPLQKEMEDFSEMLSIIHNHKFSEFKTPKILLTTKKKNYVRGFSCNFIVFEFIAGENRPRNLSMSKLGKVTKELHEFLASIENSNRNNNDNVRESFSHYFSTYNRKNRGLFLDLIKFKEEIITIINECDTQRSDMQLIHGDYRNGNMLYFDSEIYLIDFDDFHYGCIFEDIGSIFLSNALVMHNLELTIDNLLSLLKSYFPERFDAEKLGYNCIKYAIYILLRDLHCYLDNIDIYLKLSSIRKIIDITRKELLWLLNNRQTLVERIEKLKNV